MSTGDEVTGRGAQLLRYPTARLYIYTQLLDVNKDCVQATVQAAYHYELIPEGSLDSLRLPNGSLLCGSVFAARKILEGYLKNQQQNHEQAEVELETTWSEIERQIDLYKRNTGLVHGRQAGNEYNPRNCGRMAAVVFDVLLQRLPRNFD